ncbi:MAG: WD40/YVTN/BNR-like repeat-containing protein [Calditrichia bacterium]
MHHNCYSLSLFVLLIFVFLLSCGRDMSTGGDSGEPTPAAADVSWQVTSGPGVSQARSLLSLNSAVLAGSDNGLFLSFDSGAVWQPFNAGLQDISVISMAEDQFGRIYAGTATGLYRTVNINASWGRQTLTTGSVWEIFEHSSGQVFVGSISALYRSDETGRNWVKADSGIGDVSALSFCESSNGLLFAGTNRDGVFKSANIGETWQQTGLQNQVVLTMAVDSVGNIYAGTLGGGLYKSADQGDNWNQFNPQLLAAIIYDIIVLPDSTLFVASDERGVWRSKDGDTWENASDSLAVQTVNALEFASDNHLLAAGKNGLVYRTVEPVVVTR